MQLLDKPAAQATRIVHAAPHVRVTEIFQRLNNTARVDSTESRLLLLAHMVYAIYIDLKETFAND